MASVEYEVFFNKVIPYNMPVSGCPSLTSRRKLILPTIEPKQFSGEIKQWLAFWSQFSRIHDDVDMPDEDKFQYLI